MSAIRVVFTDHAIERWSERICRHFDIDSARHSVLRSRSASKSERRRGKWGRTTKADREKYRVDDIRHVMFYVVPEDGLLIVKSCVSLQGSNSDYGGWAADWDGASLP